LPSGASSRSYSPLVRDGQAIQPPSLYRIFGQATEEACSSSAYGSPWILRPWAAAMARRSACGAPPYLSALAPKLSRPAGAPARRARRA